MSNIQYSFPELKFEKPVYNQQIPQLNGISKLFETPQLKKPNDLLSSNPFIRRRLLLDMNNMTFGSNIFSNTTTSSVSATPYIGDDEEKSFADSELGRNLGNLFSSGLNSAGNTVFNNILKKTNLLEGMEQNSLSSLAGAGAGLAANYIGQGISSLGGNSMLSKGIGQGISTGLGTVGGNLTSSLFSEGSKGLQFSGSGLFGETQAGTINPYALGASMIGTGLSAAFGPSKEYSGKYGSITKGMDTAYDAVQGAVGFIPGYGQAISGLMALNKGLSNIFGSTSGMTRQDAILGSAFMPAPVKWLNMAGASKTGNFNNLSWLNMEKTTSFMGNAFGNLGDKFNKAREEAGKTYGTFSHGAKNEAQRNINFANTAWNLILAMADLDELQRIRSLYMTSINNLRYAQMILGGWNPLAIGRQGMKIFNNATNHNMGMRLLSAAALIDDKQIILCSVVD